VQTNDPKVFTLGIGNDSWMSYKWCGFRSQGQEMQKHISRDRVAGVSLHSYLVILCMQLNTNSRNVWVKKLACRVSGGLREVWCPYPREVPRYGAVGGIDAISTEWWRTQRVDSSLHDFTAGAHVLSFQMCRRNQSGSSVDMYLQLKMWTVA